MKLTDTKQQEAIQKAIDHAKENPKTKLVVCETCLSTSVYLGVYRVIDVEMGSGICDLCKRKTRSKSEIIVSEHINVNNMLQDETGASVLKGMKGLKIE